jgi:hypothetical protein
MVDACDIVVVPDFEGARAHVFEARTLLFLGSWLENGGAARHFPLHLACIGPPPERVRQLAERCGAAVTVHAPVGADFRGMSNKLRGLEIEGQHDCLLLLDADIVVLGDFSAVVRLGRRLALAPVTRVSLPMAHWKTIYEALRISVPEERVTSVIGEVMPPFYNGGVVYAPRDCGLRPLWEENMRRVQSLFSSTDRSWPEVAGKDQVGLATAVEILKRRGVPFTPLPDVFNGRLQHLFRRMLTATEIRLFHATGLLSGRTPRRLPLGQQIRFYRAVLLWRLFAMWRRHRATTGGADGPIALGPALRDAYRIGRRIQAIHTRHVAALF